MTIHRPYMYTYTNTAWHACRCFLRYYNYSNYCDLDCPAGGIYAVLFHILCEDASDFQDQLLHA